jgi:hypothetical protein
MLRLKRLSNFAVVKANDPHEIAAICKPSEVSGRLASKSMPVERGATYVSDLGYYDFSWWARLAARGCRIVMRLKKNTPTRMDRGSTKAIPETIAQ